MGSYYNGSTRIFSVTDKNSSRASAPNKTGRILEGSKSLAGIYSGAWADVSPRDTQTSPVYKEINLLKNGRGRFAVFGDQTLYVDGISGYYVYDTSSPAQFKRVVVEDVEKSGSLADDPENAASGHDFMPAAKFVVATGEHVVLLGFESGASNMGITLDQTSWWCSNSGSYLNFQDNKVTSTYSNAAYLRDTPGPIIGAHTLGRDVIVYKQKSMHKLQWTGEQNVVFRNVVLSEKAGAVSNEAVVNIGDRQVFFGYDDFYETSGSAPNTINNGVREFLFGPDGDLDQKFSFAVQSFFDRARNTVFWFYPIANESQRGNRLEYSDRQVGTRDSWSRRQTCHMYCFPRDYPCRFFGSYVPKFWRSSAVLSLRYCCTYMGHGFPTICNVYSLQRSYAGRI